VIDATVPRYMEEGKTITVPMSLSYVTTLPTSVNSDDTRTVTITDVSTCDPKLKLNPAP
jgi:hypothetical protein